jgi:hypothetical protein
VLDCDPLHEKLHRGDVGTVVHVYKNGMAYEVEFVDGVGATIALITVDAAQVRRIESGEVTARAMDGVALKNLVFTSAELPQRGIVEIVE